MTGLKDFRAYTRTLAANGEAIIDANGRYIVGLEANGMFQISIDDGPLALFFAGAKATLPEGDGFKKIRVKDTSGAPNTIVLQVGHGDFTDGRLQVSGVIRVADDSDGATSFVELQTRLQAIEDLLKNANDKRAALTDLTGAAYVARSTVGTTEVVSAAANVNGVIIRLVAGSALTAGTSAFIRVNGNIIAAGVAVTGVNDSFSLRDLFVPAGNSITMTISGTAFNLWMWYEVLPLEQ